MRNEGPWAKKKEPTVKEVLEDARKEMAPLWADLKKELAPLKPKLGWKSKAFLVFVALIILRGILNPTDHVCEAQAVNASEVARHLGATDIERVHTYKFAYKQCVSDKE